MKRYDNSFLNIHFSFLLLGLMALVMACQGNKGGEAVQKDGLYGAEARVQSLAPEEKAAVKKARVVRLYEIPAPLKDRPEQILKRKGYTVSYNSETKNPNWVAWHLTKSHTYGSFQRRQEMFSEDESVKAPRATNNDYFNSRYDRGHMCPAGDNKWDKEAMTQSFLFTNICPQNHGLNKYEWNDLEIQCRDWAREYGAVDIVCGPLYSSKGGRYKVGSSREPQQKTIGRNKVWVPDAFFKVVLCRQGRPKAIGFVYRNEGVKQLKTEAVRTVDEIEALTGIDFFPALDDEMENRIEASANLSDW
jgi:endonuclease G